MTSRLEPVTEELAALMRQFSYEPEARFFEGMLWELRAAENSPDVRKDIARDILSTFRGMGSLNDLVIMVDGKAEGEVNNQLTKLLRGLRAVAIDVVATGRSG
ncbi:DUF6966 domain-containing protein [Paenarthrobacter nitroguajacolicus]|uniref:DUF6966 domain-containing protein n=1 Tax=Paenarthrobacter nitroguajacolicus TaxID=211146 RepID=UPI002858F373|nr:hypothetical protein [Paenarthrobacter nitroguajacolicus]MDR6637640.1 hypothetical protein [Paenarthrobacter nitroguajacolicus]